MSMNTRSMLGPQVVSKRRSAPKFGFGSSTRNQASKVFLSPEHARLAGPANAESQPGPSAYTLRAAVGTQADARKSSAPQWVFGSSERFGYGGKNEVANPGPGAYDMPNGVGMQVSSAKTSQPMFGFGSAGREHVAKVYVSEEHNKSLHGIDSPGPCMYTLNGAVGRQDLSRRANQPSWVFASSNRFKYDHVKRAATSPGPGSYTLGQSVGPQYSSTNKSSPMPGFGTSNRDQMQKLYISSEHEKSQYGNNSPGPCNYALPEATGKQPLSKYSSMPSWGFGTASRWQTNKKSGQHISPGPGSYCI